MNEEYQANLESPRIPKRNPAGRSCNTQLLQAAMWLWAMFAVAVGA